MPCPHFFSIKHLHAGVLDMHSDEVGQARELFGCGLPPFGTVRFRDSSGPILTSIHPYLSARQVFYVHVVWEVPVGIARRCLGLDGFFRIDRMEYPMYFQNLMPGHKCLVILVFVF